MKGGTYYLLALSFHVQACIPKKEEIRKSEKYERERKHVYMSHYLPLRNLCCSILN